MDTINAIIVRCQSAHQMSCLKATRKAMAISLKAIRRPCWQMQQGRCEGVVSITSIYIPQQQLLPQGYQSLQWVCNRCKMQCFANQHRSNGPYAQRNNGNYCYHQHGWRQQHKLHDDSSHGNNKHNNKKSLPECKGKGFKPWCLHGKHLNHSFDEYCTNPRNQERELQQKAQTTTI